MSKFQRFVQSNKQWFQGKIAESDLALDQVEKELELTIPPEVRWLLKQYGYWYGTGISNITEAINDTKQAREKYHLSANFIVIYKHTDDGIVLLDTHANMYNGEYQVYETTMDDIQAGFSNSIIYENYLDYVRQIIGREILALKNNQYQCID